MTSYRDAGVDLEAAERHTANISSPVTATWSDDVIGSFGGFAAGVRIPTGYDDPVLMMSTDGVGTKLEVARQANSWSGVGHDLVAMCVDDLAASGARPIGFVDYLAVGALDRTRDRQLIESIAQACTVAGVPLLGGETAEHPGVMEPDAVDLAGAAMGVVEADGVLGPERVRSGDVVVGLRSPNLRSNGFSLVREVFGDEIVHYAELLLEPSVIYAPVVCDLAAHGLINAGAHITGGGLVGNLGRALPDNLGADIDMSAWDRPEIFDLIRSRGVSEDEMRKTFNLGIGFGLVVNPESVPRVLVMAAEHQPTVIGSVGPETGVHLI